MSAQHTPGPWAWENGSLQYGEGKWLYAPSGMVLDYAGCGSHECDIKEADARLIAAAPELLEVLMHIRRCIPYGGFAQIHDNSMTLAQIDAAIAKATGCGKRTASVQDDALGKGGWLVLRVEADGRALPVMRVDSQAKAETERLNWERASSGVTHHDPLDMLDVDTAASNGYRDAQAGRVKSPPLGESEANVDAYELGYKLGKRGAA